MIWGGCAVVGSSTFERREQGNLNQSPVSIICQKYMHTCFMVKTRVNSGYLSFFWFNLGWGLCMRKENVKFEFLGSKGQKVQIGREENLGLLGQIGPYLRKYKYLVKEVYYMGVWIAAFYFIFLKNFTWFLGGAKVWFGNKFGVLRKFSKWTFGKDIGKLQVQFGDKFQCTDNLGAFWVIKWKK